MGQCWKTRHRQRRHGNIGERGGHMNTDRMHEWQWYEINGVVKVCAVACVAPRSVCADGGSTEIRFANVERPSSWRCTRHRRRRMPTHSTAHIVHAPTGTMRPDTPFTNNETEARRRRHMRRRTIYDDDVMRRMRHSPSDRASQQYIRRYSNADAMLLPRAYTALPHGA